MSATCNSAVVNATTLALSDLATSSCANPALEGRTVLPVVTVEPKTPFDGGGVATVTVRISHLTPGARGFTLGPVVMSFPQESDGWPGWTYGNGDLWLFDALAKGGSQLLRISGTTGAVEQHFAMPGITRPITAVNVDGFWMAPAGNSSEPRGGDGVYRVAPGASVLIRALTLPNGDYVRWMVASGSSLWLAPGPNGASVWVLTGPKATLTHQVKLASSLGSVLEGQDDESAIVGDASGLWTTVVTPTGIQQLGTRQQVFRLVPSTGVVTSVAVLRPGYTSPDQLIDEVAVSEAVTYEGSMYLLDPPAPIGPDDQGEGFSALYRITPT